jgi:hypothetical protein
MSSGSFVPTSSTFRSVLGSSRSLQLQLRSSDSWYMMSCRQYQHYIPLSVVQWFGTRKCRGRLTSRTCILCGGTLELIDQICTDTWTASWMSANNVPSKKSPGTASEQLGVRSENFLGSWQHNITDRPFWILIWLLCVITFAMFVPGCVVSLPKYRGLHSSSQKHAQKKQRTRMNMIKDNRIKSIQRVR